MRFPVSNHSDGRRFFNPHVDTDKSAADLRRWRATHEPTPWPRPGVRVTYVPAQHWSALRRGGRCT